MSNLKLFGKRIKELRKSKKLTQEQLGEIVGVDYKQIGNIETGTYFTTMATLEKIALALEVSIDELFNFYHHKNRESLECEIVSLLKKSSDEQIRLVYKLIKSVLK